MPVDHFIHLRSSSYFNPPLLGQVGHHSTANLPQSNKAQRTTRCSTRTSTKPGDILYLLKNSREIQTSCWLNCKSSQFVWWSFGHCWSSQPERGFKSDWKFNLGNGFHKHPVQKLSSTEVPYQAPACSICRLFCPGWTKTSSSCNVVNA